MGKGESKLIHMIPKDFLKSYEEEYKILGLTRNDICLLHNIFREIQQYRLHNRNPQQPPQSSPHHFEQLNPGRQINEEKEEDDDALIKLEKLLGYFSIEKTPFTKLLFMSFDIDLFVLDHIDFPRFVQAVWNFCSLDDEALSFFVFNLYDIQRDDYLNRKKVATIISEMHGSDFHHNDEATETQQKIKEMRMRYIDAAHFSQLCEEHPAILLPATNLRNCFRRSIIGNRFWKSLSDYRKQLYADKNIEIFYVPVRVLLLVDKDHRAIARYLEKRENINPMRIATLRSMSRLHQQRSMTVENSTSRRVSLPAIEDLESAKTENSSNPSWRAARSSEPSIPSLAQSKRISDATDGSSSQSLSDEGRFLRRSVVIGVSSRT